MLRRPGRCRFRPASLSTQPARHLDRAYVAGVEVGLRNPSLRNLAKIAHALSVSMKRFF